MFKRSPRISVAIFAHNEGLGLDRAIRSVLAALDENQDVQVLILASNVYL